MKESNQEASFENQKISCSVGVKCNQAISGGRWWKKRISDFSLLCDLGYHQAFVWYKTPPPVCALPVTAPSIHTRPP